MTLQAILNLVFCMPVQAYFEFEIEKTSVQQLLRRSDDMPGTASHMLVLSDNDEFHCNFFASKHIPSDELQHFIFADYIPLTEVVTRLQRSGCRHRFQCGRYAIRQSQTDRVVERI